MQQISVDAFKEVLEAEKNNPSVDFVNVCTPAEYAEEHIAGVRNVPLDKLAEHVKEFEGKNTIYVHCRGGRRGAKAVEELKRLGVAGDVVNVAGGIAGWRQAGFPTVSLTNRMPIMRQVLLAAGLLVLTGLALAALVHPSFVYLSAFVGAGLTFAGLTGWCGMSVVLARMPWNR